MKSISLTLLAVLILFAGGLAAQETKTNVLNAAEVSKLDLSGKWMGKRKQYSADKSTFIETFQYEFELKQEGDLVTGTSTIISSNGEYADMKLEGVIVGNKFHFREYEVKGAIRPEGKVWCFKSGELYVTKEGNTIKFVGSTPSFMEVYNYPCSGGYTDLVKVDNTVDVVPVGGGTVTLNVNEPITISIFPNPFVNNATINYHLAADAKVKVEVFDISGKQSNILADANQKAGDYNLNFNGTSITSASGILIVKLTVNGEVYSRQLVQMR